ncbi:hypothetical protein [Streptococcus salivarius]
MLRDADSEIACDNSVDTDWDTDCDTDCDNDTDASVLAWVSTEELVDS